MVSCNVELLKCTACCSNVYFLVELELSDFEQTCYCGTHKTNYKHTIGFIENDKYYLGLLNYCGKKGEKPYWNIQLDTNYKNLLSCFKVGKSAYSLTSMTGEKTLGYIGEISYETVLSNNVYTCISNSSCYVNNLMECHNKNHYHYTS